MRGNRVFAIEGKSRDQINAIFRVEEKGQGGEGGRGEGGRLERRVDI